MTENTNNMDTIDNNIGTHDTNLLQFTEEEILQFPKRHQNLYVLQREFPDLKDFVVSGMNHLGFSTTDIQLDIADFIKNGGDRIMVQAQRSQAKTTLNALGALWYLIHNPKLRILILSAAETLAKEISNLLIQIINTWDILECLRPDKYGRTSIEAFDVHRELKGIDKSPSIACLGVTGNIQGRRADILIADDIESQKNSGTAVQREKIVNLTRDFTSICKDGKIIFLGTPQSKDSIYNTLPRRGYNVRIWTGRYPTKEQLGNYNGLLAPLLLDRIQKNPSLQTGGGINLDVGQPVDPVLMPEEELVKKELDQGKAYFQLQHMLDTALMDADLYPLDLSNLIVARLNPEKAPRDLVHAPSKELRFTLPQESSCDAELYYPVSISEHWEEYQHKIMYIDPAGGGKNADETAYSVIGILNGRYFLLDAGGFPGGYNQETYQKISEIAKKYTVSNIGIESNMGHGGFRVALQPILRASGYTNGIEDVWVHQNKLTRILDALEAVLSTNRLVVDDRVFESDVMQSMKYDPEKRSSYQLFFQMQSITRQNGCLEHDDRIDALAGAIKMHLDHTAIDISKAEQKAASDALMRFINQSNREGTPVDPSIIAPREPKPFFR